MAMDNREKELLADIEENIADERHRDKIKSAFGPYFIARRDSLFKALEESLKSNIGSRKAEAGDKWQDQMSRALGKLGQQVERIPDAAKPLPKEKRGNEKRLADEEAAFIEAAAKLFPLGNYVDLVIQLDLDLEEKGKELLEIWKDLEKDLNDIEEDMNDVADDIAELLEDAVEEVAANNKEAYEKALEVADYVERLPEGAIAALLGKYAPLAKWILAVKNTMAIQMKIQQKVLERESRLEREMAKRGVGVVMFSELRESVAKFLDVVNVEASAEAVGKVKTAIKMAVDATRTPGQKSDMEAFTKEILEHVEDAHDRTVTAHNKFVAANSGSFFGGVSNKTMKILLNAERWKKDLYDARISQLNSALRKLYDFDYLVVPLRNYRGTMRSAVKEHLRRELGKFYEQLERESAGLSKLGVKAEDLIEDLEKLERQVD